MSPVNDMLTGAHDLYYLLNQEQPKLPIHAQFTQASWLYPQYLADIGQPVQLVQSDTAKVISDAPQELNQPGKRRGLSEHACL